MSTQTTGAGLVRAETYGRQADLTRAALDGWRNASSTRVVVAYLLGCATGVLVTAAVLLLALAGAIK